MNTDTDTASAPGSPRTITKTDVVLSGFFVCYLELACIRWFAASVTFMQFFTNSILLGCFLGMSIGCLRAGAKRRYMAAFPAQLFFSLLAPVLSTIAYVALTHFTVDVQGPGSPETIFFGTEAKTPDVARFRIPIEVIAGFFFTVVALLFIAPGQVMGDCLARYPRRLEAYTLNVLGSLAGIGVFAAGSYLWAPPGVWLAVIALCARHFLRASGRASHVRTAFLVSTVLLGLVFSFRLPVGITFRWSPYYLVSLLKKTNEIAVDSIRHQLMTTYYDQYVAYSLVYGLQKLSGQPPFKNVLIIGSGTGNDVVHALHNTAGKITAVEIDPAIAAIGRESHPEKPYSDPRVRFVNDDGRHFLRTTDEKFDLVIYALVDSLVLRSSYSSIRLESFLFTEEAFRNIRRVLDPGGVFVTYNFFRQGFVVERIARMMEKTMASGALVVTQPYLPVITPETPINVFGTLFAGNIGGYRALFDAQKDVKGWHEPAQIFGTTMRGGIEFGKVSLSELVGTTGETATDDWPFLYTKERTVPGLYVTSALAFASISLLLLFYFRPESGMFTRSAPALFFMGAGFMLLESSAIVRLSVRFGSTWVVSAAVLAAILGLILAANALAETRVRPRARPCLLLAAAALAVSFTVSPAIESTALVLAGVLFPLFFAALAFADLFAASEAPEYDMAVNIAGAILGGLLEYASMVTGFRGVIPIIAACYLAAALFAPARGENPGLRDSAR